MDLPVHPIPIDTRGMRTMSQYNLKAIGELLGAPVEEIWRDTFRMPDLEVGNHYHRHQRELIVCVEGVVGIYLVDSQDPTRVAIGELKAQSRDGVSAVVVRPGMAHTIKARGVSSGIMIFAADIGHEDDDVDFDVMSHAKRHLFSHRDAANGVRA